jgi:hypothetical protein
MPLFRRLTGTTEDSFQIGKSGGLIQRIAGTARLRLSNLLRWLPGGAAVGGHLVSDAVGDLGVIKDNLLATSDPTISNDNTQGYSVGSFWFNTTTNKAFICADAATGAAVWNDAALGDIVASVTSEPTGFPNRTDSTISFVQGTLTFTIAPVGASFDFYYQGRKFTKSAPDSKVITDTAGIWFFYYDSTGTLQASQTAWDFELHVPVATVYWNPGVYTIKFILGEERHGLVMDWRTHYYLHNTRGTAYHTASGGFDISGYVINPPTASDADVTFGMSSGKISDEDIEMSIVQTGTPTNPFEQDLADPAKLPIYRRDGNPGNWVKDPPLVSGLWFKNAGTGRVAYNLDTAGTWSQAEAANNGFVAYWIFATNDPAHPIISIQGQRQDGSLSDAKDNNTLASLNVGGLPFVEFKVLYRMILSTATGFAGTGKAKIVDVEDLRKSVGVPGGSFTPTQHSSLSGLLNDDHTQYFNENNAGEINALTVKATPVGADVILIEDSAALFAKKKAAISTLPAPSGGFTQQLVFVQDDANPFLTHGGATLLVQGSFRIKGTATGPTLQNVYAVVGQKVALATIDVVLYDFTNATTIGSLLTQVITLADTPYIYQLTPLSNIPVSDAVLEIQTRRVSGGEVRLYAVILEF